MSAHPHFAGTGIQGQIANEILTALSATDPRCTAQILPHCPTAENSTDVSRVLYKLRSDGLIIESGRAPSGNGKSYLLAQPSAPMPALGSDEAERLMTALEAEIMSPHDEPESEGDDLDIGPPASAEPHGGDEFERSSAGCCGKCQPPVVLELKTAATALARLVWKQPAGGTTRTLTLDLSGTHPRMHTSGSFAINADLLDEIRDLIANRYREAA